MESVYGVKGDVKSFFEERSKESNLVRSLMDVITLNHMSLKKSIQLDEDFTLEEVRGVEWECEGDKCHFIV